MTPLNDVADPWYTGFRRLALVSQQCGEPVDSRVTLPHHAHLYPLLSPDPLLSPATLSLTRSRNSFPGLKCGT